MKKIIALKTFFIFTFLVIFISIHGCSNDNLTNSNLGGMEYSINVVNYSDYHFFLDTAYKSNFKDFSIDGTLDNAENIARQVSNENFEVWVQTNNTTADRKFAHS